MPPPTTAALLRKVPGDLSTKDLVRLIQQANHAYYNTDSHIMPDDAYDALRDELERREPEHPLLRTVGVAVTEARRKVELPVWMGSMDKVKDAATTCHFYMDKLDGVSALLVADQPPRLLTRGDGRIGHDISHLLPFLDHTLPATLPPGAVVRGELILPKDAPLPTPLAVPRNLVSGLVNAQMPDLEVASHVHFVAYSVLRPQGMGPAQQLAWLKDVAGFAHVVANDTAHLRNLDQALEQRKEHSPYQVDGIVLVLADEWEDVPAGSNPKTQVAFKRNTTWARAVVTAVEWKVSKDGYLKPTIVFDPVRLNGVTVQRATGFNAGFIRLHCIGPGAVIHVTRSGDVIPHIMEVVDPAPQSPVFPEGMWTESEVDLVAPRDDPVLALRGLQHFFKVVDVRGVGDARVAALFEAGHTTPGAALRHLQTSPRMDLVTLLLASNAFGRGVGKQRLDALLQHYPDALWASPSREALLAIPGVEAKVADSLLEGVKAFRKFEQENRLLQYVDMAPSTKAPSSTSTVVFSGFRDQELEERVTQQMGYRVADTVTKQTVFLVVPDGEHEQTTKEKRAIQLGVSVIPRSRLFYAAG
jgi:NAD-dependent DNA ligase